VNFCSTFLAPLTGMLQTSLEDFLL
jgi:hypothetical protein